MVKFITLTQHLYASPKSKKIHLKLMLLIDVIQEIKESKNGSNIFTLNTLYHVKETVAEIEAKIREAQNENSN